jgi:hypothetical protein
MLLESGLSEIKSVYTNFNFNLFQCMLRLGLDGYSIVSACANGIEGENLLHSNGVKTNSLDPQLYFVPWIVYDGVCFIR